MSESCEREKDLDKLEEAFKRIGLAFRCVDNESTNNRREVPSTRDGAFSINNVESRRSRSYKWHIPFKCDNPKLHPRKPLNIAVMENRIETVKELLNSGANPEERDGFHGGTGIHWAARANNVEVLELYRDRGINLSITNDILWAPIHVAAEGNCLDSLTWLLDNGAGVESLDNMKQTPLYKAAYKGNIRAAKILLSYGASTQCKDIKFHTPLSVAATGGNVEMIKLLFEHGADLNHTDSWDRNLLHIAKSLPVLDWLVKHNVDINRKDDWGRTPLHDTVQASNLQNASFLLNKGADIEVQDRNGCTPLYYAAKSGKTEFVRLFLENGADPETTAKDGTTPLQVTRDETIKNLLLLRKKDFCNNELKAA